METQNHLKTNDGASMLLVLHYKATHFSTGVDRYQISSFSTAFDRIRPPVAATDPNGNHECRRGLSYLAPIACILSNTLARFKVRGCFHPNSSEPIPFGIEIVNEGSSDTTFCLDISNVLLTPIEESRPISRPQSSMLRISDNNTCMLVIPSRRRSNVLLVHRRCRGVPEFNPSLVL